MKIKSTKIIFIWLLLFINLSSAQNLNVGTIREINYFTEIKFEYVNQKIIIPVQINNITYRFLFDTGAPNAISKRIDNFFQTKHIADIEVSDANSKTASMKITEIAELKIGDVSFLNSVALIANDDKNVIFDCFNIDGIIGSNLLRNSIIQIDIKNRTLIITNQKEKVIINKKNHLKLAIFGNQSSPYIWIKLKGNNTAKEQVLIDTGAGTFYEMSSNHYKLFEKANIFDKGIIGVGSESIGYFGNAPSTSQIKFKIPDIKISNSIFTNVTSVTVTNPNSRLGVEIFENGIGTIDFINQKFYYDSYETVKDLSGRNRSFSVTLIEDKLSVGIIWDKALLSKMDFGDEILEIDGIDYTNVKGCDFISKPILKNIDLKTLKIKSKKNNTIVIINL